MILNKIRNRSRKTSDIIQKIESNNLDPSAKRAKCHSFPVEVPPLPMELMVVQLMAPETRRPALKSPKITRSEFIH